MYSVSLYVYNHLATCILYKNFMQSEVSIAYLITIDSSLVSTEFERQYTSGRSYVTSGQTYDCPNAMCRKHAWYSVLSIYRGHISLKISRKTPHSSPMKTMYGVFVNVCIIALEITAIYRDFIVRVKLTATKPWWHHNMETLFILLTICGYCGSLLFPVDKAICNKNITHTYCFNLLIVNSQNAYQWGSYIHIIYICIFEQN